MGSKGGLHGILHRIVKYTAYTTAEDKGGMLKVYRYDGLSNRHSQTARTTDYNKATRAPSASAGAAVAAAPAAAAAACIFGIKEFKVSKSRYRR